MKTKALEGYKLARPDGFDFYTGRTIQYRASSYPHIVQVPGANASKGVCSSGVGHASATPNDCFIGAKIPCSAYRLRFVPACGDTQKWGWTEAEVLGEILDLDALLGWRYSEACNPLNPPTLPAAPVDDTVKALLDDWRDSVRASVRASVWASVRASVRASVWDSVWDSVGASVWAYVGYLFQPAVPAWRERYPFQSAVDLWRLGFLPSFDGTIWRLHAGPEAKIVWYYRP